MVPKQLRAVKQIYLGNILNIQLTDACYAPLFRFLASRVDTRDHTLKLGRLDDPISIPLFEGAKKVFGVKSSGTRMSVEGLGGGMGGHKGPRGVKSDDKKIPGIINHLKNWVNYRKRTCKIFTYGAFRMIFAPSSSTEIDLRLSKFVEDIDKFEELNLTQFIVDYLEMGADDRRLEISGVLVGSPHLLAVSTLLISK
jgi:hypothetical protein